LVYLSKKFLDTKRITGGVTFWQTHNHILERAHKIYHINPEVIVAIIGVESAYGLNKGKYSALDMLTTIAFTYPRRSVFFKKN